MSQPAASEGWVPVGSEGLLDHGACPGCHKLLRFMPFCLSMVELFHPFWEQFGPYPSSLFLKRFQFQLPVAEGKMLVMTGPGAASFGLLWSVSL